MGLADWFSTFCGNIQVKNRATISSRYRNITKRLNTDFWSTTSDTAHSLYVGSYGRNTAIHGTSDVDMIFRLPDSIRLQYDAHLGNGQSALLQAVRASVKKTYSSTDIGADGQVVEVSFGDDIRFDLVPAFTNADGSFTYPDSNSGGNWKTDEPETGDRGHSEPKRRVQWQLDPALPDDAGLEGQNECADRRTAHRHLGVSVHRLLGIPPRVVFSTTTTCVVTFSLSWPTRARLRSIGKPLGAANGSTPPKGQFQYKARRAYNLALEAIEYQTTSPKRQWSAKRKWREVFGTSFPS